MQWLFPSAVACYSNSAVFSLCCGLSPVQQQEKEGGEGDAKELLTDDILERTEHISLEELQSVIAGCRSDEQLVEMLHSTYRIPPGFLYHCLGLAVSQCRLDLLGHALRINSLLPGDSVLQANDEVIVQLLQKSVAMDEMECFRALLPHVKHPEAPKTKMELQSLVMVAAQLGRMLAVRLLCFNFSVCLEQSIQGTSVFLQVARSVLADSDDTLHSVLSDLLDMGVYVNTQEPDGNTALHIVAEKDDLEAVRLLLSFEACTDMSNAQKKKPLDLAHSQEVLSLLDQPADVAKASLYLAAANNNMEAVHQLLDRKLSVNSRWIHGRTAVSAAARAGNGDMVDFLLSLEAAPIPLGCYWPDIPIMHALVGQHTAICEKLMYSTECYLAQSSEMEYKHVRMQLVLLLHYCCQVGATSVAKLLLSSKLRIDPNVEFRERLAPIHVAAKHGQLEMVKLLLRHKAKANLPSEIYYNTALHYATFYGHTSTAKFILGQPRVSVNCKNIQHETPLYCVLHRQLTSHEKNSFIREKSVIFLIRNGANLRKPGRRKCELKDFSLDMASQRWAFVPVDTQKLILVLRDEERWGSLCSDIRLVIRGAMQVQVSETSIGQLGLPYRLENFVLLKDWFS